MAAVSPISLVGREQPLRRLTRALDEASAGIGRLVLISGEPGVGKTSLVGAVLAEAERRGARTAVGVCWDGAGAPGLWPWVQVLRSLRSTVGAENWQTASGPGSDALARLLDSDQSGASAVEFHVFDAMLQLLASLASARPLVAFIDAGANSIVDHVTVLDQAISQLPAEIAVGHRCGDDPGLVKRPVQVRTDSAGCTAFVWRCRERNIGFAVGARSNASGRRTRMTRRSATRRYGDDRPGHDRRTRLQRDLDPIPREPGPDRKSVV